MPDLDCVRSRRASYARLAMLACRHLVQIREVTASVDGCEDCLLIGASWVHLRLCMICGHVGCCDSSKSKHATAHFRITGHPIMKSFEPGEKWGWCYVDELELDPTGWPIRGRIAHSA
jgi:uncharacterized UBP type Zn finger protein